MILSLRAKIMLITAAILLVMTGINTLVTGELFLTEYSEELLSSTKIIGHDIQTKLESLLEFGILLDQLVGFEEQCQEIVKEYEKISHVIVVNLEGKVVFHNEKFD